jgi:hypothetical protein
VTYRNASDQMMCDMVIHAGATARDDLDLDIPAWKIIVSGLPVNTSVVSAWWSLTSHVNITLRCLLWDSLLWPVWSLMFRSLY